MYFRMHFFQMYPKIIKTLLELSNKPYLFEVERNVRLYLVIFLSRNVCGNQIFSQNKYVFIRFLDIEHF